MRLPPRSVAMSKRRVRRSPIESTSSPLSTSAALKPTSVGEKTAPKLPVTSTDREASAIRSTEMPRFWMSAPRKPMPPAVATRIPAERVEKGTWPATDGMMSVGSMRRTTNVESSRHSPL
eukprot:5730503-Prymnesium_polylepis.1